MALGVGEVSAGTAESVRSWGAAGRDFPSSSSSARVCHKQLETEVNWRC